MSLQESTRPKKHHASTYYQRPHWDINSTIKKAAQFTMRTHVAIPQMLDSWKTTKCVQ